MPYNSSGVFANVAGATSAVAGQIIQSAVWNNIHADYSLALNEVMGQLITTPTNRNAAWMNGGLEVWQRGAGPSASIAVAASSVLYTADRWYLATDTNEASVVAAQAGLVSASRLCGRVQRNSGQTGTGVMRFAYPFDTDEIVRGIDSIVNLSFRIRAGANWSPASGTLSYILFAGTGSVIKRNATPYTGETSVISGTVNLTPAGAVTLVQTSSAAVLPVGTTQLELQFFWTPVGTAGTNDYFEIDDVQLEPSLSSSDWTLTAYDRIPFETMLDGCKGHYQKTFRYNVAPAYGVGSLPDNFVGGYSSNFFIATWGYEKGMRTTGGATAFSISTATASSFSDNVSVTATALITDIGANRLNIINLGTTATAATRLYINLVVSSGI